MNNDAAPPANNLPPSHPLLDMFIQHLLVEKGLSENTAASYTAVLNSLLSFLAKGNLELESVTDDVLMLYLAELHADNLSSR
ncbi:MAG: site-specific integrase, partial [Desulfovibrionaceae bacterium]|nr:site-specific integrase [Desulfovibrionaceae bacterium]